MALTANMAHRARPYDVLPVVQTIQIADVPEVAAILAPLPATSDVITTLGFLLMRCRFS